MNRLLKAGVAAALALGTGAGGVIAQSSSEEPAQEQGTEKKSGGSAGSASSASSPFSGWFGGSDGNEASPIDLDFQIGGRDSDILPLVRNTSLLVSAQNEGRVTGQDLLAAARGDYARILGVLYDQGYFSGLIDIKLDGVEAAQIAPLDAPKIVRKIVVTVDPGPRFRYSRAQIAPLAPGTKLPPDYKDGGVARTGDMKTAATTAVSAWRDVGHAKADVAETDIIADHRTNLIDSRISLNPGPSLRFGELTVRGYERMDPRRLHKIAGFPTGERFDPEKLEDVRKRLRRSGVFSAITLTESDYVGVDDTLDVDLLVVEQKLRRIGGGFEISSLDGLAVTGYWIHRNLLGGGERLRFDTSVKDIGSGTSGMDYTLGARLDRPATITADTTGYVQTEAVSEQEEEYDLKSATVGLGFIYLPNDKFTADIALQFRAVQVDDESGRSDFRLFALPTSVTWDMRDDQTDAKRGYYLSTGVTPFVGLQDETGSGARMTAEGRGYYSFGLEDKYTLAGRAMLGTVAGPEIEEVPRDYLFYSGGGGTVRGHSFESLGVRVIPGESAPIKTGGMSIATLNAEVRIQVREKIGLAVFADAGRVWAEGGFSGENGWQAGAGAGIRYKTPIGPLRFDIAAPVGGDDDSDDSGVQVYIGLGQAF